MRRHDPTPDRQPESSAFSAAGAIGPIEADGLRAHFAPGLLVRTIAIYRLAVAALYFLAWMSDIVPAIVGSTTPASLHGLKLPTDPVHVLDLSALLPLAALSGIWLWQRRTWGHLTRR